MTVTEEKLQVILITYNREKVLKRTLVALLANDSPIRNCDILVLDNNSTDGTGNCVTQIKETHMNLSYQKNKYNLGISGNIYKAMEAASKEYYWIVCDDDFYDWSAWQEVEEAMSCGEDMIVVARYCLPDDRTNETAFLMRQYSFVGGAVVKTAILNDNVMRNAVDNIYTLFPHLVPMVALINQNKKIHVISRAIVAYGRDLETDCSYTRGSDKDELYPRTVKMSWMLGYAGICSGIKEKSLREKVFITGFVSGFDNLHNYVKSKYDLSEDKLFVEELLLSLNEEQREIVNKQLFDVEP